MKLARFGDLKAALPSLSERVDLIENIIALETWWYPHRESDLSERRI